MLYIRNDDAGVFFDVFYPCASKQYLCEPREINRVMYYYYIYAVKGDTIFKEFAAYTDKHTIDKVFDELVAEDYDCVVIDDITRDQYIDQHDPYDV